MDGSDLGGEEDNAFPGEYQSLVEGIDDDPTQGAGSSVLAEDAAAAAAAAAVVVAVSVAPAVVASNMDVAVESGVSHALPPVPDNTAPAASDILLGRGRGIFNHTGNRRFRHVLDMHRGRYEQTEDSRAAKTSIIVQIVSLVRQWGRFLKRDEHTGDWCEADDDEVRRKVGQCLRNKRRLCGRVDRPKHPAASLGDPQLQDGMPEASGYSVASASGVEQISSGHGADSNVDQDYGDFFREDEYCEEEEDMSEEEEEDSEQDGKPPARNDDASSGNDDAEPSSEEASDGPDDVDISTDDNESSEDGAERSEVASQPS